MTFPEEEEIGFILDGFGCLRHLLGKGQRSVREQGGAGRGLKLDPSALGFREEQHVRTVTHNAMGTLFTCSFSKHLFHAC